VAIPFNFAQFAGFGKQSHRAAKAIAWIRENYAKPMQIEDLANLAGMGISPLRRRFLVLTTKRPLQHQTS
jgi:transcriptional regulator GlxA family with amidase domain